jgi:hypothetical protein
MQKDMLVKKIKFKKKKGIKTIFLRKLELYDLKTYNLHEISYVEICFLFYVVLSCKK